MNNMTDNKALNLSQMGEFGLINHLTHNILIHNQETIKGVGDDAAVISNSANEVTLISTDLFLEGIHFDLTYTPFKHLGYKCIASACADILAMNGVLKQVTISMGLSSKMKLEFIEELYSGFKLASADLSIDIIGGDTTTSLTGLTISITAIGVAPKNEVVYRNGAKPSDLICVTGDLGAAYMGLQILEREKYVAQAANGVEPDFSGREYLLERQLKPSIRTALRDYFKELEVKPTSMIDVSDGVASDVRQICLASGVGCKIYEDKLPIDHTTSLAADEMGINPTVAALNGGDDYEMLFTISITDFEKFSKLSIDPIYVIGHITETPNEFLLVTASGQEVELKAQGWGETAS